MEAEDKPEQSKEAGGRRWVGGTGSAASSCLLRFSSSAAGCQPTPELSAGGEAGRGPAGLRAPPRAGLGQGGAIWNCLDWVAGGVARAAAAGLGGWLGLGRRAGCTFSLLSSSAFSLFFLIKKFISWRIWPRRVTSEPRRLSDWGRLAGQQQQQQLPPTAAAAQLLAVNPPVPLFSPPLGLFSLPPPSVPPQ